MTTVTLATFTESEVLGWFAARDITKARPYVDLVHDLEITSSQIKAAVPGSAAAPYIAQAMLSQGQSGEMMLMSRCTCSAGRHCKHVAAMLLKVVAERAPKEGSPAAPSSMLSWADDLRRTSIAVAKKKARPAGARQQLFYIIKWTADRRQFGVEIRKGKFPESAEEWWKVDRAIATPPQFVTEDDLGILRLIWAERGHETGLRAFGIGPKNGAEILQRMVASHRLYPEDDLGLPLQAGALRPASIGWQLDNQGFQRPYLKPEPSAEMIIAVDPPWYLDLAEGEIGPLKVAGNPSVINRLFSLPPLSAKEAAQVAEALSELAPVLPPPGDDASARLRLVDAPLIPILQLDTLHTHGQRAWRDYPASHNDGLFDIAKIVFRYADADIRPEERNEFITLPEGETIRLKRRPEAEAKALEALATTSLQKIPGNTLYTFGSPPEGIYGLPHESSWQGFMQEVTQQLKEAGWQIEFPEDFRHHVVEVEGWEADLVESDNGWFNLDMGIIVEGERLPLAPLLAGLFRRDPRWLEATELERIPDSEGIELHTSRGKRLRVPAGRIKPLASTLIDLFDGFSGGETLRLSRFDAPRLAELNDVSRWQFRGQSDIMALAERLQDAQGIKDITPPAGFNLELRPYQKEGLAWLQFLRERDLSGILADDMGLGKTAQTLAHLLLEKEAGRLDKPALVILPTSLIFNWKNEAARFAPTLKVLSLHGPERKQLFGEIANSEVILTTYPLLWRDADELMQHSYHLLILDEAQTVKNAQSQSAEAVRKIDARHRLCLTGTPLENHLGELWSQFDFLLPGFLGTAKQFTRHWRTPIERQGDTQRRDLLARRIRPFILRRKKEDVAQELPPKTIIVRSVELEGAQRDLYETVRAAMDAKVRDEIASKGFARSQIVILDALLKLRQVCCDPRLVKANAARRVSERAKLDLLMAMVPELVDEGRKILIFSQFTSMLALIEHELDKHNIGYTLLTGDTNDRETPIRRFQEGEVPIFLISLKAGGVGLNLTAADTVIHYDPWWNPAVENQATDRAHRLGQDKPVFVYKLIVSGSIEEKILALQERKAELAAGILSEDRGVEVKFGTDDLAALFEPLPV
ncbi:DEAD/DEAH box helicase [Dechloromonas denitrificans]|uniref:DEAD/DEAH box helicase n=1 Tax=Dechloromonas denitrificans TaxID=281362 RepID=UPI001CF9126B|nr:DEAD/DEAH box helicase [Dechloromonas denitrificans]UCV11371.1 DEAD/DEAH box helicase [Dechloromonas denitrificans]